jgi:polar amino acid transport system substrate-binding protein
MKKVFTVCLVLVMAGLFCAQGAFAGSIIDKIVSEKKLRVGVAPWKNFILWDSKTDRYEGIIADELRNFEKVTGIKVEIFKTSWGGMIAGLQAGKWDTIMNGLGASVQRSLAIAFTEPYGYYCEVALVRTDDTVNSFADLDQKGNKIAVIGGTSAHTLWKDKFKNAEITTFTDASNGLLDVMNGRAKAFMSDLLVNSFRAKERPELKLFIPENTTWFYQAHACRYGDPDLLAFLNTYVRNMKVRGWYEELGKKWGMPAEWSTGKPK